MTHSDSSSSVNFEPHVEYEFDEQGNATGRQVSIFTVAKDPGRILKYLGSLVLIAGILVMYLMRR
jgi:hypothetical protein